MGRKKWIVSKFDKELCAQISEDYGVPPFAALLAVSKGITDEEELSDFFGGESWYFDDPYELPDMDKAVSRIERAIFQKEKIVVFGDYDADGVTSTALVYSYLKKRGADVSFYIPDRNIEGYGMNIRAIEKIASEGAQLVITVDNGISAFEEAKRLHELGVDLVITDHHRASQQLPVAHAVVDVFRLDCECDVFKERSGVGIAFKLIEAMEGEGDDTLLDEYSELVAIGTIGDVVSLRKENRQFVMRGTNVMNNSPRLGIKALLQESGLDKKEINSLAISFAICPRINAAGRMGSALTALKLLLCEDEKEAQKLAKDINEMNIKRQKTEQDIFLNACEIVESCDEYRYSRVLVIDGENWHTGVIGIVAAKMVEKYSKPCLIISRQVSGEAKGSGRSIEGFSLFEALKHCENELIQYGGHTLAVGFSVQNSKIDDFRRAINEYALRCGNVFPKLEIDCKVNPKFLNLDLFYAVKMLEPFGAGNKQPIFGLYNMYVERIEGVSNGKHSRMVMSRNSFSISVMKFSVSPNRLPFRAGDTVDVAVTIDTNEFMGTEKLSVIARDIKFSSMSDDKVIDSILRYEKIKRAETIDLKSIAISIPTRELTARVYKAIKSEGVWLWGVEALDYRIGDDGERLCAVMVALDALEQLGLIERDRIENTIRIVNTNSKTDLNSAPILVRLKSMM